jgi:hypothetical protein
MIYANKTVKSLVKEFIFPDFKEDIDPSFIDPLNRWMSEMEAFYFKYRNDFELYDYIMRLIHDCRLEESTVVNSIRNLEYYKKNRDAEKIKAQEEKLLEFSFKYFKYARSVEILYLYVYQHDKILKESK